MTPNNNKDLSLNVDDFYLNIRVAIIARTKNGFILEKKKHCVNYNFFVCLFIIVKLKKLKCFLILNVVYPIA